MISVFDLIRPSATHCQCKNLSIYLGIKTLRDGTVLFEMVELHQIPVGVTRK